MSRPFSGCCRGRGFAAHGALVAGEAVVNRYPENIAGRWGQSGGAAGKPIHEPDSPSMAIVAAGSLDVQLNMVLAGAGPEREFTLHEYCRSATVGDLLDALAVAPERTEMWIDDQLSQRAARLSDLGLYEGAVLDLAQPGSPDVSSRRYLHVISGTDAGRRFALSRTTVRVGRDPTSDIVIDHPSVSDLHCKLTVSDAGEVCAIDAHSRDRTWMGGERLLARAAVAQGAVLGIGSVAARVGPLCTDDRSLGQQPAGDAEPEGLIVFNRPPRDARPPAADPLAPPIPPVEGSKPPLPVALVVAPLLVAVSLVITREADAALSAMLGGAAVLLGWCESAVRLKLTNRRALRRYEGEVEAFGRELAARRRSVEEDRRAACPDVAELVRRATLPSVLLWERRPAHADFLRLAAGLGEISWRPGGGHEPTAAIEVAGVVERCSVLHHVPIEVRLGGGDVVGLVGERHAALALARRLLCEAAVHHGPADVAVAVIVDSERRNDWEWAKWLPHTRNLSGASGARWLSVTGPEADEMILALRAPRPTAVTVAVIDADILTEGRRGVAARALLRGEEGAVAGLVIASSEHRLPADCDTVVDLRDEHGTAYLRRLGAGERIGPFLIGGMSDATARDCSRSLARFEDPELDPRTAGMPDQVALGALLGEHAFDAHAVLHGWTTKAEQTLRTPLGVSPDGVVSVDLCRDGPHCWVAGATGSGATELLRTLIAGLAVGSRPDQLTFLLIDHKGGGDFAECASLPHTLATIPHLGREEGARVMRYLEAELRSREQVLKAAAAHSFDSYLRRGAAEPLPRLVIVVNELGTLAGRFISRLISVARRGRTLGVHLVTVTGSPSSAPNDELEQTCNLRIALRVLNAADSTIVIGSPEAADIARDRPGRACVRVGADAVTAMQTAHCTRSAANATADVVVAPFEFGPAAPRPASRLQQREAEEPLTDLRRLVQAIKGAHELSRMPRPRPWAPPLPVEIDVRLLSSTGPTPSPTALVALADDPDTQSQYATGWNLAGGNLLVFGPAREGPTGALCSLAVALGRQWSPDALYLYAVDFGPGHLAALDGLPHAGAIVGPADRNGQLWLLNFFRTELARRQAIGARPAHAPRLVLLIDNAAAEWFELLSDPSVVSAAGQPERPFDRVFQVGPNLGIHVAIAARRREGIPSKLADLASQRWVFEPDDEDRVSFGLRADELSGAPVYGRAIALEARQLIQVGRPKPSLEEAVAEIARLWPPPARDAPRPSS